jgi:hypothetical protein
VTSHSPSTSARHVLVPSSRPSRTIRQLGRFMLRFSPQAEKGMHAHAPVRAVADVRDVREKSDCSTLCDARREPVHG